MKEFRMLTSNNLTNNSKNKAHYSNLDTEVATSPALYPPSKFYSAVTNPQYHSTFDTSNTRGAHTSNQFRTNNNLAAKSQSNVARPQY